MKVAYINPFLTATQSVLQVLCNTEPQFGKPYLRTEPYAGESVVIVIGVTGAIRGQVIIAMTHEIGKGIASRMMGGMPVDGMDDMAKSALGEMANMILGNSSTNFANEGINIAITPPTILAGNEIIVTSKVKALSIPVEVAGIGSLEITIAAKEA